MTDRELLEMAAKAYADQEWHGEASYMNGFMSKWNSLDNDADAFGLACHLNMDIEINEFFVIVRCPSDLDCVRVEVGFFMDKKKNLRLAITKAAAESWSRAE